MATTNETRGSISNTTEDTVKFILPHNWNGKFVNDPTTEIPNDNSGSFLHMHTDNEDFGSRGAVVYQGKDKDKKDCHVVVAWSNPYKHNHNNNDNKVYTLVQESAQFKWDDIKLYLESDDATTDSTSIWHGFTSVVNIGTGAAPNCEISFSLNDAQPI